jgi:gluconate kinase
MYRSQLDAQNKIQLVWTKEPNETNKEKVENRENTFRYTTFRKRQFNPIKPIMNVLHVT